MIGERKGRTSLWGIPSSKKKREPASQPSPSAEPKKRREPSERKRKRKKRNRTTKILIVTSL